MTAILQMIFSNPFYWIKTCLFLSKFHWYLFPRVRLTNKPALVQIMDWCQTGDEPLTETMMFLFTDAYMRYSVSMVTSSNGTIFRVTGHFSGEFTGPQKGQWRGALMFSLICVWINDWVNNLEAGDLRRYRAYYDVTVMSMDNWPSINQATSQCSQKAGDTKRVSTE